jgi:hypothetical protein
VAGGAVPGQIVTQLKHTLTSTETDAVISQTLAQEALAAEQARRAVWRHTLANSEYFTTSLAH